MLRRVELLFFMFISLIAPIKTNIPAECNRYHANFVLKDMVGIWYVVALIPGNYFPENQKEINCYKMELTETDEAGLRWLITRKIKNPKPEYVEQIRGTIIRQRFYTERPFDIWSKTIPTVRGCFRQLLSLETNKTELVDGVIIDAQMQLHLFESNDGPNHFLVQLLWGNRIAAVVYRRVEGVHLDELRPLYNMLTVVRGHQNFPLICDNPPEEITFPPDQRP